MQKAAWGIPASTARVLARSIPIDTVWAGDTDQTRSVLAWDPEVRVQVLHSGRHGDGNLNNDSIVIRLSYGAFCRDPRATLERIVAHVRDTVGEAIALAGTLPASFAISRHDETGPDYARLAAGRIDQRRNDSDQS